MNRVVELHQPMLCVVVGVEAPGFALVKFGDGIGAECGGVEHPGGQLPRAVCKYFACIRVALDV